MTVVQNEGGLWLHGHQQREDGRVLTDVSGALGAAIGDQARWGERKRSRGITDRREGRRQPTCVTHSVFVPFVRLHVRIHQQRTQRLSTLPVWLRHSLRRSSMFEIDVAIAAHCRLASARRLTAVQMSWRKIVCCLAVLAMVLHAAMLVRHSGAMLAAKTAAAELSASLSSAICHGNGGSGQADSDVLPDPAPSGQSTDCPMCLGQCAAMAVLPDRLAFDRVKHALSIRQEFVSFLIRTRMAEVRPPSTGPPSLA